MYSLEALIDVLAEIGLVFKELEREGIMGWKRYQPEQINLPLLVWPVSKQGISLLRVNSKPYNKMKAAGVLGGNKQKWKGLK